MESKRVCKLLIVIFSVLSLLFYFLYSAEIKKRTVIFDELVFDAVKNLEQRGITIDESCVERKTPERDIYFYEAPDINETYKTITSSVCNVMFSSDVVTTEFDTPDGYSVGIYDKAGSDKELGRIMFSKNESSFVFSKSGLSMKNGDEPIENMQTEEISDKVTSDIERIVSGLTFGSRLGYKIKGSSSNDTFLIVTVMQTVDNSDISNAYMNFVFQDEELVILYANLITGSPKAKYHNTLLDGVNVLYKLNLDEVKEIQSEEVVYTVKQTDNSNCFIVPCWKIKYFDKNEKLVTAYFDAL